MNKLLSIATFLVFFSLQNTFAQNKPVGPLPYDSVKGYVTFNEVVMVPGATKDQLYDRAMNTLTTMYEALPSKLIEQDKVNGKIVVKGFTRVLLYDKKVKQNLPDPNLLNYKLTIQCKDGRYRYEFTDFYYNRNNQKYKIEKYVLQENGVGMEAERAMEKMTFLNDDIIRQSAKLKTGMASDAPAPKNTDW